MNKPPKFSNMSSLGRASLTAWLVGLLALGPLGCGPEGGIQNQAHMDLVVTAVNGAAPPSPSAPLPPNLGDVEERWDFEATIYGANGLVDDSFNGYARLSSVPGAISRVEGPTAAGRNVLFVNGHAQGTAIATAMFGPTRLWIEDLGYQPAPPGVTPICSNGLDDDGDILNDFPSDPGCAFADDMSEDAGQSAIGVSAELSYERPTVADVQGRSSQTPYPAVAVEIKTSDPNVVVVTRVSSDGFYVSDLGETQYNNIYAFNFSTPAGMRVCDRLVYLTGTASEFFGYTEISFPSFEVQPVFEGEPCLVPEPTLLQPTTIQSDVEMERLESGLVRIEGFRITGKFGPELAFGGNFTDNASNCDLNEDGVIDFLNDAENSCSNACAADADCTEWIGFASRGNYKVSKQGAMIQINTGTATLFNPLKHKGQVIAQLTGTLRNFSGGSLNWTVETRCGDDLVCDFDATCTPDTVPIDKACVKLRTLIDNDSGSN